MALKSAAARLPRWSGSAPMISSSARWSSRYFSMHEKGRILSEEEQAAETVYIQKMERERLAKLREKLEKEKAAVVAQKTKAGQTDPGNSTKG